MKTTLTVCLTLFYISQAFAQVKTNYPDIPRIYVHTHVAGDYDAIQKYLDVREILVSQNRMLCACGDYETARRLSYKPDDLEKMREQGFIGYKIYGPCYLRFLLATYPNINIYD